MQSKVGKRIMPRILALLIVGHLVGWQEDNRWVRVDAEGFAKCPTVISGAVDAGHVDSVLVRFVEADPIGLQLSAMGAPRRKELDGPGFVSKHHLVIIIVNATVERPIAQLVRLLPIPVVELVGEKFTRPEAMDVLEDRLPWQGNVLATL